MNLSLFHDIINHEDIIAIYFVTTMGVYINYQLYKLLKDSSFGIPKPKKMKTQILTKCLNCKTVKPFEETPVWNDIMYCTKCKSQNITTFKHN